MRRRRATAMSTRRAGVVTSIGALRERVAYSAECSAIIAQPAILTISRNLARNLFSSSYAGDSTQAVPR